jgi:hypothetical protein
VNGRPDQKSNQPARNQESDLGALKSPGAGHIVNDIGRFERVVAVEQGQKPHDQAKPHMEAADLCAGEFFMNIDTVICHHVAPLT